MARTTHLRPKSKLRMSGDIPSIPQQAFTACIGTYLLLTQAPLTKLYLISEGTETSGSELGLHETDPNGFTKCWIE